MTTSMTLYNAILAMDSYNRFQDEETDAVALNVSGITLGNATRKTDIQLPAGYDSAGFFATAWDLNGDVIISYRGTDFGAGGSEERTLVGNAQ